MTNARVGKAWVPLLALALLLSLPPANAAKPKQPAAKLEQLKSQIDTLNKKMHAEVARKQTLSAKLGKLERRIGALHAKLTDLAEQKKRLERQRGQLEQAVKASRKEAHGAREALSEALRTSFVLGREPRLKLALEGKDPSRTTRTLAYYGYYSRARAQHIEKLVATIERYDKATKKLDATEEKLSKNVAQQRQSLAGLEKDKQQREGVVKKLDQDISGKQARLAKLKRDAKRLEKVVRSVHRDLEKVPAGKLAQVDFAKLRGKLSWPVAGTIVDHYGSSRADGDALKWEAIRIAAPAGAKVHAIAYGRVAYAGWLPFYGLVLMVDHGHGYLVVYGHNEALYKQVGEWVEPGDVVATVGQSGGQPRPMLYFQIRHGERPLNPGSWCKGHTPSR
jgi:septal ring factor EnvC (AmiA/AmiB activator)